MRPNVTNLDTHYVIPDGGLWNAHEENFMKENEMEVPNLPVRSHAVVAENGR